MNDERRPPIFCFPLFLLTVAFWAAIIWAAILLVGCGTTGAGWANVAQAAAQVGTAEYLAKHPDQREAFEITAAALQTIYSGGFTNPDAFAQLILSLPIKSLHSPTGSVSFLPSGHPVIWDGRSAMVGTSAPVLLGIVAGIKGGIHDSWASRPIPSETVALGWDKIPAVLEVVSNAPPALSSLAVTFRAQSNVVYGIEHTDRALFDRAPSGEVISVTTWTASPDWRRIETIKMPTSGEITWFMAWPPNRDPGLWRVLKLR